MSPEVHTKLVIAGRILSGCVGVLAEYVAFFMYEDEEGSVQNRLEEVWVGIHERARKVGSRNAALMNSASSMFQNLANRLFGEELTSDRAIQTSGCLTLAGIALVASLALMVGIDDYEYDPLRFLVILLLPFAAVCLVVALMEKTEQFLMVFLA